MSTPIQDESQEILSALREAVIFEQREKMDAPVEAKAEAQRRVEVATNHKLALIKQAYDRGVPKVAIAAQLGIRNLGQVTKLIERAEGVQK